MSRAPKPYPLPIFGVGDHLAPATVFARNNAAASDNKIHDDTVARQYGFRGGLVPGVTVYAYLARMLAEALGTRWLTASNASVSFVHPVYEGDEVTAQAVVDAVQRRQSEERVSFECWVENAEGTRCAVGSAEIVAAPAAVEIPDFVLDKPRPLPPNPPPFVLAEAPIGATLSPLSVTISEAAAREYAGGVFDLNPIFNEGSPWGSPLVHPGRLLSECNTVFRRNFTFGPWIHTRSTITYFGPAPAGHEFTFHAQLIEAYERRGHEYAVLDVFCVDASREPLMRVRHTAIVRIRQGG